MEAAQQIEEGFSEDDIVVPAETGAGEGSVEPSDMNFEEIQDYGTRMSEHEEHDISLDYTGPGRVLGSMMALNVVLFATIPFAILSTAYVVLNSLNKEK